MNFLDVSLLWPEFESRPTPRVDTEFVRDTSSWACSAYRIELVELQFDTDRYDPNLYSWLNIGLPDSIRRSVRKRQAEFLAGRIAARLCLERHGFAQSRIPAIRIGMHRDPIWPSGFVGSITHTENRALCAICPADHALGVGIDLENILSLEQANSIALQIHDHNEHQILTRRGIAPNTATTLIFSAKESLFKALYPSVGDYFGFERARLLELPHGQNRLALKLDEAIGHHGLPRSYSCSFVLDMSSVFTLMVSTTA